MGHAVLACFGDTFVSLVHKDPAMIAASVACAARALQSITDDKPGVPELLRASSWLPNPSSYGPVLVQMMTNWFIGLSRAISNMHHYVKLSLADAAASYEERMVKLGEYCGCEVCVPGSNMQKEYCQVIMVESMVTLGVSLSRMILVPQLFPRESGSAFSIITRSACYGLL
jgi:hypothetical protein